MRFMLFEWIHLQRIQNYRNFIMAFQGECEIIYVIISLTFCDLNWTEAWR